MPWAMGEDEGDPSVPKEPEGEPEREIADALASVSPAALAHEAHTAYVEQLLKTVRVLEACESRMHALRAHVVSALHEEVRRAASSRVAAAEAVSVTASEIAAALNVGQRNARSLVDECLTLADPGLLPVLEALREGRLTRRQARAVVELAVVVPPRKRAAFCAAAVAMACPDDPSLAPSPGALGRRLRRLVEKYADERLAERKERAAATRRVDIEPAKDGMCWLTAHLPVEVGAAIDTRLEALARSLQGPEEERGIGQLRADVFRDLMLGSSPESPVGGVRTEVVVTVPARTLSGESDTAAEILGYGPLDAPTARLLAAQAETWTTMWVDPGSGAPLALGRRRYSPSLAIRRFLGARDRACRFPGCDKPAAATEADHTIEWQDGGETDTANLALLCREHHRLKSLGLWRVRHVESRPREDLSSEDHAPPAGVLEWSSPTGRRYITYPESDAPPPF